MRKLATIIASALVLITGVLGGMFALDICPPSGPWPTPPWCASPQFERTQYNISVDAQHLPQIKAVNMFDTWGRNYNMGMIETTRNNVESSFARIREIGATEVWIHDFHRAVYPSEQAFDETNYTIEDEIFANDMRDESLSEADITYVVSLANTYNLKLGIKHNLHLEDMSKYLIAGMQGDIQETARNDYEKNKSAHSDAWRRDFMNKWHDRLIERARLYEQAGVSFMSVSPSMSTVSFAGMESEANTWWKQTIADIRKVFTGSISAEVDLYGLRDGKNKNEDWSMYDYYTTADIVEIKLYGVPNTPLNRGDQFALDALRQLVNTIDVKAQRNNVKLSVFFAPSSYRDGLARGPVEFYDTRNEDIRALEADYTLQSDAWHVFFQSIITTKNVERIIAGNFNWDDALDPDVTPRYSISASFRNKPAEEVIRAWYTK